jgi:hypothetical protein
VWTTPWWSRATASPTPGHSKASNERHNRSTMRRRAVATLATRALTRAFRCQQEVAPSPRPPPSNVRPSLPI